MRASTLWAAALTSVGWVKRTAKQRELLFCGVKQIDAVLMDAEWILEERTDDRNVLAVWIETTGRRNAHEVEVCQEGETLSLWQRSLHFAQGTVCIHVRTWGKVPEVNLVRINEQF